MFKSIIAAVDGSESAEKALVIASELAAKFNSHLHIINVPQDDTAALVSAGYGGYAAVSALKPSSHYKEIGERIVKRAEEKAIAVGAKGITTHVLFGDPAENILKKSNELSADLVVSGRRGLGGVKGLIVGSTTQQISKGSGCAILTTQ
jgi:nucleotide-binding universal stress UspA family protein